VEAAYTQTQGQYLAFIYRRLLGLPMPFAWVLGFSLLAAGCGKSPVPPPVASATAGAEPSQPLPKLPTVKLWLGNKEVIAEKAITRDQLLIGMMFRKQMGEDEGMLYILPQPQRASFGMHNTPLPLSCAYIDGAGVVLEIHDLKPFDETPILAATSQVQYVLALNRGWFERSGIGVGTAVRTERGSLSQTFFRGL
jgi:uncharacterized protein